MSESRYLLGHTESEIRRLVFQSTMLRDITTRLLVSAGIKPGMRVLDLGCGPGDVSMLVAKLVGPRGSVIGIDRSLAAIKIARKRATDSGLKNVAFSPLSLADFTDEGGFDMVTGRYVLMYQPEPTVFLQCAVALLRPGGKLAFHEVDITRQPVSTPFLPLFDTVCARTLSAFKGALSRHEVAVSLGSLLHSVNLTALGVFCEIPVECGQAVNICRWVGESFCSAYPETTEIEMACGQKISTQSLVDELIKESQGANAQIEFMRQVCAWGAVP